MEPPTAARFPLQNCAACGWQNPHGRRRGWNGAKWIHESWYCPANAPNVPGLPQCALEAQARKEVLGLLSLAANIKVVDPSFRPPDGLSDLAKVELEIRQLQFLFVASMLTHQMAH